MTTNRNLRRWTLLKKGTGSTTVCICPHGRTLSVVVPVPFFSSLRWARRRVSITRNLAGLHADQGGSISISTVFAVLLLAFLLGMVMNSSLQVDQKVKMQNAADAATCSGAVVLGRSMNTLAFTNHLLCDTFALTAFMRAGRDRHAESLTPDILDNWERIAPALAGSEFRKFADLGVAIGDKVPHEREVVRTFSDWAAAASELMLPVFEQILAEQRITEYQRAVVRTTPQTAQAAAEEVARRHGQAWPRRTALHGCLWRTDGTTVASSDVCFSRLLPVVDPMNDDLPGWERYAADARQQRFVLAHGYLRQWNDESLPLFDQFVKMSQFASLWRIFTGGHLQKLLNVDYPDSNLPFQILTRPDEICNLNGHLEQYYMVVGVVYRAKMSDRIPGVFRNPVAPDTTAYAQAMVFVPRRRLIKVRPGDLHEGLGYSTRTGIPGQGLGGGMPPVPPVPPQPQPPNSDEPSPSEEMQPIVVRQNVRYHPEGWSLINQNWTAQLVPATAGRIPWILSSPPGDSLSSAFNLPALGEMSIEEFLWISNH